MSNRLLIFDTTLRDGEQSPGISLNVAEKVEIAEQLARLGVDVIEAGFPVASPGDFESVRAIAQTVKGATIAGLSRTHLEDIDRCWEAIRDADQPRIHVFIATSPIHMEHKLRMTPDQVKEAAVAGVKHAKKYTSDVEFSPEDGTRSDPDFLVDVLRAVVEAGATTLNIPDTVGYAIPSEFASLISYLIEKVDAPQGVVFSTHCHNDLGLATANSLAGVAAGARQVECTINGIGERAGNAALEEIVMAVKVRSDQFGVEVGIATEEIARTSRLVSRLTGYPVQPNKAVVGRNAFAHESGIHQHGVLMNRKTYEIIDAEKVGRKAAEIVLGKHSGRHAFQDTLEKMGIHLQGDSLNAAFKRFKELADRKSQITQADVEAIVAAELGQLEDTFVLEEFEVRGGTSVDPVARVVLRRNGDRSEAESTGDGMIDAACAAISKAAGVSGQLVAFNVSSVTEGTDALGDVTIQLEVDGRTVTGRGVSTDVVEASARAYLSAVNIAVRLGSKPKHRKAEVGP
ncbi:MAG: 2-isopropylmalate synthase [Acidimicrobiia bacterium]